MAVVIALALFAWPCVFMLHPYTPINVTAYSSALVVIVVVVAVNVICVYRLLLLLFVSPLIVVVDTV